MEKINLPFFYLLGSQLNPLTVLTPDISKRRQIIVTGYHLGKTIRLLLETFSTLTVCRAEGKALLAAIEQVDTWFMGLSYEELDRVYKPDSSVDSKFQKVVSTAKEFEVVLSAELQTLDAYHVTQKGIYDTTALVERADNTLPIPVLDKLDEDIIRELRESGKCLAFDCATASAFHIPRIK